MRREGLIGLSCPSTEPLTHARAHEHTKTHNPRRAEEGPFDETPETYPMLIVSASFFSTIGRIQPVTVEAACDSGMYV